MKMCSRCGENKSTDDFYRDKRKRDGLYPHCKTCHRAFTAGWKKANPGRHAAINAESRNRDPERQRAIQAASRERHPETATAYRAKNKDKLRAYNDEWASRNGDRVRELQRQAYRRNWAVYRARSDRRSALTRGATLAEHIDRGRVFDRDGGRCHICGKSCRRDAFTLDHLVPLSKGGEHTYENVRLAHLSCNSRRGAGRLDAQLLLVG